MSGAREEKVPSDDEEECRRRWKKAGAGRVGVRHDILQQGARCDLQPHQVAMRAPRGFVVPTGPTQP